MQAPHRTIVANDERERFLIRLLDALWARYRDRVEWARRFESLEAKAGRQWRNDHAAFRTLARQEPASGVFSLSRLFQALGYAPAGCYEFPDKKLSAVHLQHRNSAFPKVFISELRVWELSAPSRRLLDAARVPALSEETLARLASPEEKDGPLLDACLDVFSRPWAPPAASAVRALDRESQYGAWVLAHGHEVNHFTGAVADIEAAVAALKADGVPMKAEIEGAPGTNLRQSSTEAVVLPVETAEGTMEWTYAYFELAQRSGGFEGFLGGQAAGLFEMTRFPGPRR